MEFRFDDYLPIGFYYRNIFQQLKRKLINYKGVYHRNFKTVLLSRKHPETSVESEITLKLNWLGRSSMEWLDEALKAIHVRRANCRIYWQVGPKNVLPIFNFITLASATHTMSEQNHILYIVKREKGSQSNEEKPYSINEVDQKLVIQTAMKKKHPGFTGYTRFEEATHVALTCAGLGEHLPLHLVKAPPTPQADETAKIRTPKSKK